MAKNMQPILKRCKALGISSHRYGHQQGDQTQPEAG